MSSTAWTTEPPTVPGWYWLRFDGDMEEEPVVVEIVSFNDKCCVSESELGYIEVERFLSSSWAGPLFPPEVA